MKLMHSPTPIDTHVSDLLRRGFYSMLFQPIRETKTGREIGFEALLRGPKGSPLARPGTLFSGQSLLSRRLLRRLDLACIGAALRSGRLIPKTQKLFINVHGDTMSKVAKEESDLFPLMESLEVAPERIVLEISETTDAAHVKSIARLLSIFRKLGVQIALDDVGLRYPWLYHFLHLEPEYIKVDRAFVKNSYCSPRKAIVLRGLLDMAVNAGALVIAEGIESEEDWKAIEDIGVHYGQGFWLGRPSAVTGWTGTDEGCPHPSTLPAFYDAEETLSVKER